MGAQTSTASATPKPVDNLSVTILNNTSTPVYVANGINGNRIPIEANQKGTLNICDTCVVFVYKSSTGKDVMQTVESNIFTGKKPVITIESTAKVSDLESSGSSQAPVPTAYVPRPTINATPVPTTRPVVNTTPIKK